MKAVLRALWLISGILLVVFGIYALFHPAQTLLSMTMFLGIATVLSGVFSIATYIWQRGELFGGGWILLDGILDTQPFGNLFACLSYFGHSCKCSACPLKSMDRF